MGGRSVTSVRPLFPGRTVAERVRITLVCGVCDARNYRTTKASVPDAAGRPREPLTMKKYCPTCGKHTLHRESK